MKHKKTTAGSLLGLLVLGAIYFAMSQGWLPDINTEPDDAYNDAASSGAGDTPSTNSQRRADAPPRDAGPNANRDAPRNTGRVGTAALPGGDGGIGELFRAQRSDVVVTVYAMVKTVLPDDNDGSRHQKLILTLSTGETVLLAHNIDLAERVPCDPGDVLRVRGEYEWSAQGGVIHWTHRDPAGRHQPGWIEFEGTRYE